MTSTHRTAIASRARQCVAATALMAGIAIGAAALAGATPMNWDSYNRCIINGGYIDVCCINAGGDPEYDDEGYPVACAEATSENVPLEPGPTTPPPVLQNPPAQPSNPLIPVPRGHNSGTLG